MLTKTGEKSINDKFVNETHRNIDESNQGRQKVDTAEKMIHSSKCSKKKLVGAHESNTENTRGDSK